MVTSRAAGLVVKRGVDVAAAGLLLLVLSPLLAAVAVLIYLDDAGPVLFRQRRVGVGMREFELLKFRTMRVNDVPVEAMGQVREHHPLVTPLGRILRRSKVDELLQLVNVLRGDMSLIGPRPTVPELAARYDDFERRRLETRPGMTGWAQINGNVRLTWAERIALDVWYVDHWSLRLDVGILLKTVGVVVLGEQPNAKAVEQALVHTGMGDAAPPAAGPGAGRRTRDVAQSTPRGR